MLAVLGEQILIRKFRKAVHSFDKHGMLPNAEIISDTQCKFLIRDGSLTLCFTIEKSGEIYYVFSLTVMKTLLENISSTVYTDSIPIHSFSIYGALESSMAYVEENVKMFAAMR